MFKETIDFDLFRELLFYQEECLNETVFLLMRLRRRLERVLPTVKIIEK